MSSEIFARCSFNAGTRLLCRDVGTDDVTAVQESVRESDLGWVSQLASCIRAQMFQSFISESPERPCAPNLSR